MIGKILALDLLLNIVIHKNWCNPCVFIQIFIMMMDTLKKAYKKLDYKLSMSEIKNKSLLAGENFMCGMLRQPGFTYSACGLFTKNKDRLKKLRKQEIHNIFQNYLDKACFQKDMAYEKFEDLPKRTASYKY